MVEQRLRLDVPRVPAGEQSSGGLDVIGVEGRELRAGGGHGRRP
jgi:hypothetical protein